MATAHNRAEKGDFAKTVLMPGDPLRARFMADNYMDNVRLVTDVRNIYGFTGEYKGKPVSVMASGMGMPSIGIYSYELYAFYDVECIIRTGSAGSYNPDFTVGSLVITEAAYSDSTFALYTNNDRKRWMYPDSELNSLIRKVAKDKGLSYRMGKVHSSDQFYYGPDMDGIDKSRCEEELDICEMESFALFCNANMLGRKAGAIFTVSDDLTAHISMTAEQREKGLRDMMLLAFETAIEI